MAEDYIKEKLAIITEEAEAVQSYLLARSNDDLEKMELVVSFQNIQDSLATFWAYATVYSRRDSSSETADR